MKNHKLLTLLSVLSLSCSSGLTSGKSGRPMSADTTKIEKPSSRTTNLSIEIIDKTFDYQLKQALDISRTVRRIAGNPLEALNVNEFDEVENSSWFTNRNGLKPLPPSEIRSSPAGAAGPDPSKPWVVHSLKSEGVTPGLTISDSRGGRFLIKFDPVAFPELGSGTEVVATRLFFAAGYNVPENHIAYIEPENLVVDPGATVKSDFDEDRPMDNHDLQKLLANVNPHGKARIRVLASRFLPGIPIGPWSYTGTREDDPNDRYPHEHRRELRGLYVIASWLNHADMKEENTLDTFDPDKKFVTHYLIDFGASMGSNSKKPSSPRRGQANSFDLKHSLIRLLTLGLYVYPYEKAKGGSVHPSVGYLDNNLFEPGAWKPMYPAPPFENLTLRDAFWGARIVTSFSDKQIASAVSAGEFSDSSAADLLAKFLTERRDRIGHYWFSRVNPLDRFEIAADSSLHWKDLAADRGYVNKDTCRYKVRVFSPDNSLVFSLETTSSMVSLEGVGKSMDQITVSILPIRTGLSCEPVLVYISGSPSGWVIDGLERLD